MHPSRRTLMGCGCLSSLSLLGAMPRLLGTARAATLSAPTSLSPDEALAMLQEGNRRFLAGNAAPPESGRMRRTALTEGQAPFAVLLCCSDSRAPPELLFSRGLGEIFTVRNAGNTVDATALGSIEYGVAVLGAPLLVVLGHEKCGAVQAAIDVVLANREYPGAIGAMIEPIVPAVLKARSESGELLDNAVREHVRRTVRRLTRESEPLLAKPLLQGKLKVVGARYDLHHGEVEFFAST